MSKESFKINPATELKERTAALNTQLRFGRERPALMHAYQLRAFLQLRGARTDDEKYQLARVEKVIVGLEKRKTSGIQRLLKTIIETAIRSMTPDDDSERTLLDQFSGNQPSIEIMGHEDEDLAEPEEPTVEPVPEEESEPSETADLSGLRASLVTAADEEDDYGWGAGETISSTPSSTPRPTTPEEPQEDHWGGGGGYSYDDKF